MELKLWDYYKNELKSAATMCVLVVVLIAILKFLHWSTVETIMGSEGGFWDWVLRVEQGISALLVIALGYVLFVTPYQRYKEHRNSVRAAAMATHWEGALTKVMRDFGKTLKDGNELSIDNSAKILLKEIQIQCTFGGRRIREMQTKLEGICEGILVDLPKEFAEKIELQLIVDPEDLYEYLQLKVGGRVYKRSLCSVA
ncbi:hypothetical protein GYA27_03935 [candidate division WWE3 bacterium]|uniref:Uncharacterized protein n=1 Tax=candidate division WWE3 bacterium TaxID=2053526 RepID=A0A7X9DL84_UNCKA|nr:hypothetical protein [candidate division WWE3 bacterium]